MPARAKTLRANRRVWCSVARPCVRLADPALPTRETDPPPPRPPFQGRRWPRMVVRRNRFHRRKRFQLLILNLRPPIVSYQSHPPAHSGRLSTLDLFGDFQQHVWSAVLNYRVRSMAQFPPAAGSPREGRRRRRERRERRGSDETAAQRGNPTERRAQVCGPRACPQRCDAVFLAATPSPGVRG